MIIKEITFTEKITFNWFEPGEKVVRHGEFDKIYTVKQCYEPIHCGDTCTVILENMPCGYDSNQFVVYSSDNH